MSRWVKILGGLGVGVAALVVAWYTWISPQIRILNFRARVLPDLKSTDPAIRAAAIYEFVDRRDPELFSRAALLLGGDDPDSAVREACAYVIGRHGNPAYFPAIQQSIELETHGLVRAAAWLAAARIDPQRFRDLLASVPPRDDAWDRIGRAQGLLDAGDPSQVKTVLLRFAIEGDDSQRYTCTQAMYKGLLPLLEVVGRWPLKPEIIEGDTWPEELTRAVAQRCEPLDLAAIRNDSVPHFASNVQLQQTLRRLTRGRDRIAQWLVDDAKDTMKK